MLIENNTELHRNFEPKNGNFKNKKEGKRSKKRN
jgi:hypothetical protein